MTNPIKQDETKIIIDKEATNSLIERFLAAAKAFLVKFIGQDRWDRLGLDATWIFFLPVIMVITAWVIHYLSYWLAGFSIVFVLWYKFFKK